MIGALTLATPEAAHDSTVRFPSLNAAKMSLLPQIFERDIADVVAPTIQNANAKARRQYGCLVLVGERATTKPVRLNYFSYQSPISTVDFCMVGDPWADNAFAQPQSATDAISVTSIVLNRMYALVAEGAHKQAVAAVFARIEGAFSDSDLDAVNDFLASADVSRLSVRVLVAMLRSSSRASDHLYAWTRLLEAAKDKARADAQDVDRLFWGLN